MSAHSFSVVRRAWIPGQPLRPFVHENVGFEVTWVEQGELAFQTTHSKLEAGAHSAVLLPPAIENTPVHWRAIAHQITLDRRLVEEAADALGSSAAVPCAGGVLQPERRVAVLAEFVASEATAGSGHDDPGLCSLVDALAFALVRAEPINRQLRQPDRRIRRALARIEDDFSSELAVDELAREAGMSRFAFSRTFKEQTGKSPYQHLLSVRLLRAAELLRTTNHSVLEVALAAGFADPGRFARRFRAHFGCLPREFRTRSR